MTGFFERVALRSREAGTYVCVGLDPDFRRHAPADIVAYNRAIIEATAPYVACFKPNIAFYEQWGVPGLRALEDTLALVPTGIPVIGDVKRGDIGNTAEAYARAMFQAWGFDAVTLSGYMGRDTVEPFLAYADRGVFILCRTSNPGAREFQGQRLEGGRYLFEAVAIAAAGWGPAIGLVVGATAPAELRRVRELVPGLPLLVPGVGAQGGSPGDVVAAAGAEPGRLLVNASRSVYYAGEGPRFAQAAAEAARALRDDLNAAAAE